MSRTLPPAKRGEPHAPQDPVAFLRAEQSYETPAGGSFANQVAWKVRGNTSPDPASFRGPAHVSHGDFDPAAATSAAEGLGYHSVGEWEFNKLTGAYGTRARERPGD